MNMLDTGFDCPEVVNLVFARFTKSAILYQQMRGRGTRKSKGKPCSRCSTSSACRTSTGTRTPAGKGATSLNRSPEVRSRRGRASCSFDVDDHIDPTTAPGSRSMTMATGQLRGPMARASELGARFEAWLLDSRTHAGSDAWLRRHRQADSGQVPTGTVRAGSPS